MPTQYKAAIVEVVRRHPEVTFIWKYDEPEDSVGEGLSNLVKTKWMPQTDLLGLLSV